MPHDICLLPLNPIEHFLFHGSTIVLLTSREVVLFGWIIADVEDFPLQGIRIIYPLHVGVPITKQFPSDGCVEKNSIGTMLAKQACSLPAFRCVYAKNVQRRRRHIKQASDQIIFFPGKQPLVNEQAWHVSV